MNRPSHPDPHHPKQRNPESGFAILFIYALAATIAITLFLELPRVAFEAQRDKEQLLIDRGEQYSRAVQLYVRKFNRYPPDFDALDNTQNLRFLRQHYKDPMTGKEEWRLIHVGPGGVFIDSLNYNKKKPGAANEPQNFITEVQQVGGNQTDSNQGVNIAGRVRPSDLPGAPGDPNNPQLAQPQLPPGFVPPGFGQPGFGQAGLPQQGLPQQGVLQPGVLQPGVLQPGVLQPDVSQLGVPQPGVTQPGMPQFDANGNIIPNTLPNGPNPPPGFPGQVQNSAPQFGGLPPGVQTPVPFPVPANGQANVSPAGAGLIGQLLSTPRPGGLNGLSGAVAPVPSNTGTPVAPTAQTIGGGIAGVASKREQEGIKVYKDKTKYNEWEFVYDITKDTSRAGGAQVPQPSQQGQQQQGQQQSGQQQQSGNTQPGMQASPQQIAPPPPAPSP